MAALRQVVVLPLVCVLLAGCVAPVLVPAPFVVPVPPLGYASGGKDIKDETVSFIRTGATTKLDVVWELGAPDTMGVDASDESRASREEWIAYTSFRHRGGVVAGIGVLRFLPDVAPYGVGVERWCKRPRVFKVWFDEAGVVKRHAFSEGETVCETTVR